MTLTDEDRTHTDDVRMRAVYVVTSDTSQEGGWVVGLSWSLDGAKRLAERHHHDDPDVGQEPELVWVGTDDAMHAKAFRDYLSYGIARMEIAP